MNRFRQVLKHAIATAVIAGVAGAGLMATTNGPDAGGYTGTDATVYSFVDISGGGGGASVLAGTDDGTVTLTLPFAFRFYGQSYTLLCVSSNGALYFVTSDSACTGILDFANTDLSSVAPPGDLPSILPLWSDLTFQVVGAGAVLYQTIGTAGNRRFVVQWNNAYPQGSPDPVTFQVVLSESNNAVLVQYKTVGLGPGNPASNGGQATIGLRNTGAPASQEQIAWSYRVPVIGNSTALLFSVSDSTSSSGLISGGVFIGSGSQHHHFVFRVSQRQGSDYGRLEYWVNESSRCAPSDHAIGGVGLGARDNDYGQNHGAPDRFQASSFSQIVFASDPPVDGSKPTDTATFGGTGLWNGQPGYTFEGQASDQAEPGRGRDTFALIVRDPQGSIVANVNGVLTGGNIQSNRVKK